MSSTPTLTHSEFLGGAAAVVPLSVALDRAQKVFAGDPNTRLSYQKEQAELVAMARTQMVGAMAPTLQPAQGLELA